MQEQDHNSQHAQEPFTQAQVQGNMQQQAPSRQAGHPAPQKTCKKCHGSIPVNSEICPICGANLKPIYKKVWFWILVIFVLFVVVVGGCVGACSKSVVDNTNSVSKNNGAVASSAGSAASAETPSKDADKYAIADEMLVDKGYGTYAITGIFTNTSGKEYSYVQLTYTLYDESGAQIGEAYANANNLKDATAWKYEAYVFASGDDAPASFELSDVSGW